MGDYRKLEVRILGCSVTDRVYVVVERLPRRLQLSLGDDLVRASSSVHSNIAEGCGLNSDPYLAKHVRYALGSANEVEDALTRLEHRGLLQPLDEKLLGDASLLRRKLGAFLKTVEKRATPSRRRHKP